MDLPTSIQKRRGAQVRETEDSYPASFPNNQITETISPHHPTPQSEPSSGKPATGTHHPSIPGMRDSAQRWRFPLPKRLFGASIFAARIPFVRAGDIADEFTNNFITDVAPLLALFGERVATQFMSQSFSIADSIIFAVAPLGIMTAMVGAIRVGGPDVLRAIIGRARESRSVVELELMSSTSSEVCELWNGEGIVRTLGTPQIIELIYVTPDDKPRYECDETALLQRWESDVGVYNFKMATTEHDNEKRLLTLRSSKPPNPDNESSAPNISLNMGGQTVSDLELWTVAVVGILLQLGVVVFAGSTVLLSPWNLRFKKGDNAVPIHAFPLMAGGTLALVLGMFLCAHIVERSTAEETWEVKELKGATVKVAWLQKGGVVSDQLFNSHALFAPITKKRTLVIDPIFNRLIAGPFNTSIQRIKRYGRSVYFLRRLSRRWDRMVRSYVQPIILQYSQPFRPLKELWNRNNRPSIRTSRRAQPTNQHSFVVIAIAISLCGFFAQFMGLRWLHWSVTVVQLVVTVLMTVLRAWVRRNLIHKPVDRKIEKGYELEWMAREVKGCQDWNVVTWGFDKPTSSSDNASAASVMTTRRRLAALSGWPSQWSSAANSTTEAIEAAMNFLFSSDDVTLDKVYWSTREHFEWKIMIEVRVHPAESHLEEVTLTLKRSRLLDGPWGPWRAVRSEVEAVLGLWMLHFHDLKKHENGSHDGERSDWQSNEEDLLRGKPTLRVLGPYDKLWKMNYERWIGRRSHYVKVGDLKIFTEGENKRCEHVIGNPTETGLGPETPVLAIISDTVLDRICGQTLLAEFISNIAGHVTIGGEVCIRGGERGEKDSFGLSNTVLAGLAGVVEQAKLANIEEAYMSIVPALCRSGKLPTGLGDAGIFTNVVEMTNSHIKNRQFEQAEWFLLWLFHYAETSAGFCIDQGDWRKAGEIYLCLRRVCEDISYPNEHTDEADRRIALFCENTFTSIAMPRDENNSAAFSDTLDLVSICMTEVLGEIAQKTLARWKDKNSRDYLPISTMTNEEQLLQAATDGKALLVERLLRDGTTTETLDSSQRTPLILACISGHAGVVRQLIQKNAKTTTQDYYGRTPLHYASEKGYSLVVQILLLCDGPINIYDKKKKTPLELAIEVNAGAVVNLLLFYGAEDLDGGARRLLHESCGKGSELAVNLMKKEDLGKKDTEYHRAPVHWSVWKGSERAIEMLLDENTDVRAKDRSGQTPLHIAAVNGSLAILEMLLKHGADKESIDVALSSAARNGHLETVRLLLDRGADKKAKHWALYRAAENGHLETVRLLLDRGPDKEARGSDWRTPLSSAASNGHLETVRLLLDRGADNEVKDRALYHAALNGHLETVRLLLDRGAGTEVKDFRGRTALQIAMNEGHQHIVDLLLK